MPKLHQPSLASRGRCRRPCLVRRQAPVPRVRHKAWARVRSSGRHITCTWHIRSSGHSGWRLRYAYFSLFSFLRFSLSLCESPYAHCCVVRWQRQAAALQQIDPTLEARGLRGRADVLRRQAGPGPQQSSGGVGVGGGSGLMLSAPSMSAGTAAGGAVRAGGVALLPQAQSLPMQYAPQHQQLQQPQQQMLQISPQQMQQLAASQRLYAAGSANGQVLYMYPQQATTQMHQQQQQQQQQLQYARYLSSPVHRVQGGPLAYAQPAPQPQYQLVAPAQYLAPKMQQQPAQTLPNVYYKQRRNRRPMCNSSSSARPRMRWSARAGPCLNISRNSSTTMRQPQCSRSSLHSERATWRHRRDRRCRRNRSNRSSKVNRMPARASSASERLVCIKGERGLVVYICCIMNKERNIRLLYSHS